MPPLFQARVTINQSLLNSLRELPRRTQENLRRKLQTELKPELQKEINTLFAQGPEPVSDPFMFGGSDGGLRSRQAYFWILRHELGIEPESGGHWPRRNIVEQGFDIQVSDRLRLNLILVRNFQPEAKYVFGPWLVRGHALTGWPDQFEMARELIRAKAIDRVVYLAKEALSEAMKK